MSHLSPARLPLPFSLDELGNTYVESDNRYVVSLIVGYSDREALSPQQAVANALDLTRDDNAYSTHWYVFDRHTHTLHLVEQQEAEPYCES